jgi:hypothetical protein
VGIRDTMVEDGEGDLTLCMWLIGEPRGSRATSARARSGSGLSDASPEPIPAAGGSRNVVMRLAGSTHLTSRRVQYWP